MAELADLDPDDGVLIVREQCDSMMAFAADEAVMRVADTGTDNDIVVYGDPVFDISDYYPWHTDRHKHPASDFYSHGWYTERDTIEIREARDLDAWPPDDGPDWPEWVPEDISDRLAGWGVDAVCDLSSDDARPLEAALIVRDGGGDYWLVVRDDKGENAGSQSVAVEVISEDDSLDALFEGADDR